MRTMKVTLLAIPLLVTLLSSCSRQDTEQPADSALPAVFGDGAGAKYDRVDNVHQVRFIEIFLVGREVSTGDFSRRRLQHHVHPPGHPGVERHCPASAARGPRFRPH
jgi:hypothetical protein